MIKSYIPNIHVVCTCTTIYVHVLLYMYMYYYMYNIIIQTSYVLPVCMYVVSLYHLGIYVLIVLSLVTNIISSSPLLALSQFLHQPVSLLQHGDHQLLQLVILPIGTGRRLRYGRQHFAHCGLLRGVGWGAKVEKSYIFHNIYDKMCSSQHHTF